MGWYCLRCVDSRLALTLFQLTHAAHQYWPSASYSGTTASVTFDQEFEEVLYALRTEDRVRFEGVVERAGGSIGIDGTAIEQIE